jgi:lipopolysaccharide transport protein LptA
MAAPRPSKRNASLAAAVSGTALVVLAFAGSAPVLAAPASATLGNCGKLNVDAKKGGAKFPKGGAGSTSLIDVTITADGCDMEIKARSVSATSLDLDDSDWTLDGDVRIRSEQQQSKLTSDRAVVQFRNSEIVRITMTGNPAEFEQRRPDSGAITRGHARQMVYEAGTGIVRLMQDAWLSDGGKEIKTPQLVYDIRNAEIRSTGSDDSGKGSSGSSGGSDRVIITIDPKASKKPPAPSSAPAKP